MPKDLRKTKKNLNDDIAYKNARSRVRKLKGVYIHVIVFVLVNPMLMALNLATVPEFLWFFFPLMGWSIGLFFHILSLVPIPFLGKEWEERKIQEILDRN